MFETIRNNNKILMGLLLLLIIPSFVMFGIEGYSRFRDQGDVVATVGKVKITRPEWDNAHRNAVDRQAAAMPGIDRSLLDTEAARQATLERLVNDAVLARAAQDAMLVTTDQRLATELMRDPTIAGLRKADGSLDVERYQQLLRGQGLTPETFEASVRSDLARQQVLRGVSGSVLLSKSAADSALRPFFEQREVQVAVFRPADFAPSIRVSDADVAQFYQQNTSRFQTLEQADVELLVLDLDALAKTVTVSESDLRTYHEQNSAQLAQKEQRRARHILLTVDSKAAEADKAKVRAEAQALLDELRKSPERFADLAKQRSQDPGSAPQGGDLDFFGRGAMVKPFEDAVYALQKGQISDLVETEFGFHIIQLTDVRKPQAEPFEAVRAKLEAEYRQQQAQRRFAEAAENFGNLVYEQSDALQPVAEKLGLTVRTAKGLTRTGPADGKPDDILTHPKVLAAVFNPDALSQKRNSEAIELGKNRLVAVRVQEHRPSVVQPLEAVAAQVRQELVREQALAAAKAEAKAKLDAWQAQPSQAQLRAPILVSRNAPTDLPPAAVRAAMSAPAGAQTAAWVLSDLGEQGALVIRVNKVLERPTPTADRQQQERDQLAQLWAQVESDAYLKALRARYKVEIKAASAASAPSP